jgi:hypothetical protein
MAVTCLEDAVEVLSGRHNEIKFLVARPVAEVRRYKLVLLEASLIPHQSLTLLSCISSSKQHYWVQKATTKPFTINPDSISKPTRLALSKKKTKTKLRRLLATNPEKTRKIVALDVLMIVRRTTRNRMAETTDFSGMRKSNIKHKWTRWGSKLYISLHAPAMHENLDCGTAHARKVQTSTRNVRENARNETRSTVHVKLGIKPPRMRTLIALVMNTKTRRTDLISHPERLKALQLHLEVKRDLRARTEVNIGERRRDLGMSGTLRDQSHLGMIADLLRMAAINHRMKTPR